MTTLTPVKTVNADDPLCFAEQIARAIASAVDAGEFAPTGQLPSRRILIAHFNASHATIQRAINMLKDKGIVISRQGRGVFTRQNPESPALDLLDVTISGTDLRALDQRLQRVERTLGLPSA